jgi:hypothetical protein
MFQKAHNMPSDMLRGIHNMFKTCITWIENVFRNHKAKTNKAKGRLGEKITSVVFVLTAFTFFGRFNIFPCGPWTHIFFSKHYIGRC